MATLEGKWTFKDVVTSPYSGEASFTFVDTDETIKNVTHINFAYSGNYLIGNYTIDGNVTLVYDESRTTGSYWWHSKFKNIKVPEGYENATLLSFLETNAVEDKFEVIQRGIAGKIATLATIKNEIKEALANKGKVVTDDFTTYAQAITSLSSASAVSNIDVDDDGIVSWGPPTVNDLANPSIIGYIIDINGTLLESTTNSVDGTSALINGSNVISVVAVISFENEGLETTLNYPKKAVIRLSNATLIEPMYATSAVAIGGKAYIFGGYKGSTDTSYNKIQCYDPNTDTLEQITTGYLSKTLRGTIAVAIDEKAYIFGGYGYKTSATQDTLDIIHCYDNSTGKCSKLSVTLPRAVSYGGAVAIDGKIYIFGSNGSYARTTGYIFEPLTETVTSVRMLNTAVFYTSAVAIDGKMYIFGGYSYPNTYSIIQCYEPLTSTVTTMTAQLTEAVSRISVVEINGKAYIFGGSGDKNYIQKFNPKTDTITIEENTLVKGMKETSAVAIGGKAYIFGGSVGYSQVNTIQVMTLE